MASDVRGAVNHKIGVNVDIVFYSMPCVFIEPSVQTSINKIGSMDIVNNLTWEHIDATYHVKHKFDRPPQHMLLEEGKGEDVLRMARVFYA